MKRDSSLQALTEARHADPFGVLGPHVEPNGVVIRAILPTAKQVTVLRNGSRPVEMTRKEFAILRLLASRAGEVITRDELLNEVWGYESYPVSRTVDNHIALIRSKLEDDPAHPEYIRTVHGVGYRFVQDGQDESH